MSLSEPKCFDDLSKLDQQKAHWMLFVVAESMPLFGWYGFASIGLTGFANRLVKFEMLTAEDGGYSITSKGRKNLKELSAKHDPYAYVWRDRNENP